MCGELEVGMVSYAAQQPAESVTEAAALLNILASTEIIRALSNITEVWQQLTTTAPTVDTLVTKHRLLCSDWKSTSAEC